jgi:hypothetical protein
MFWRLLIWTHVACFCLGFEWPIELTLVTPDRIEGRAFTPPLNAKVGWNACTYSPPADWQPFTWIPVS